MADKTYSPATVNDTDSSQVKNAKKTYNDLLLKPNRSKKEENDFLKDILNFSIGIKKILTLKMSY